MIGPARVRGGLGPRRRFRWCAAVEALEARPLLAVITVNTTSRVHVTAQPAATPTQTLLTADPNPAVAGTQVIFTATIVGRPGIPTGSVVFTIDGVARPPVAVVDVEAPQAAIFVSDLPVGNHTVVAAYSGGGGFAPSASAPLTDTIAASTNLPTQTSLTSTPNPATAGQAIILSADVQPLLLHAGSVHTAVAGPPTGPVVFTIDGVAQRPVNLFETNGHAQALFTVTHLPVGTHTITATYEGDANHAPSTSPPITQTVLPAQGDGPHVTRVQRFGFHA